MIVGKLRWEILVATTTERQMEPVSVDTHCSPNLGENDREIHSPLNTKPSTEILNIP
jgi:hypothetical protein